MPLTKGKLDKYMGEALRCSICFDIFENPHSLPCLHTFCEGCGRDALNSSNSCPECRRPFWNRDFVPNYKIAEIVNCYQDAAKTAAVPLSQQSVEEASPMSKILNGLAGTSQLRAVLRQDNLDHDTEVEREGEIVTIPDTAAENTEAVTAAAAMAGTHQRPTRPMTRSQQRDASTAHTANSNTNSNTTTTSTRHDNNGTTRYNRLASQDETQRTQDLLRMLARSQSPAPAPSQLGQQATTASGALCPPPPAALSITAPSMARRVPPPYTTATTRSQSSILSLPPTPELTSSALPTGVLASRRHTRSQSRENSLIIPPPPPPPGPIATVTSTTTTTTTTAVPASAPTSMDPEQIDTQQAVGIPDEELEKMKKEVQANRAKFERLRQQGKGKGKGTGQGTETEPTVVQHPTTPHSNKGKRKASLPSTTAPSTTTTTTPTTTTSTPTATPGSSLTGSSRRRRSQRLQGNPFPSSSDSSDPHHPAGKSTPRTYARKTISIIPLPRSTRSTRRSSGRGHVQPALLPTTSNASDACGTTATTATATTTATTTTTAPPEPTVIPYTPGLKKSQSRIQNMKTPGIEKSEKQQQQPPRPSTDQHSESPGVTTTIATTTTRNASSKRKRTTPQRGHHPGPNAAPVKKARVGHRRVRIASQVQEVPLARPREDTEGSGSDDDDQEGTDEVERNHDGLAAHDIYIMISRGSCKMSSADRALRLAHRLGARSGKEWSSEVTHVVVPCDHTSQGYTTRVRTAKYLTAVAARQYVVSADWLQACLEQQSILVDPTPYLVAADPYAKAAVLKALAQKRRGKAHLFHNLVVYTTLIPQDTKAALTQILRAGGAELRDQSLSDIKYRAEVTVQRCREVERYHKRHVLLCQPSQVRKDPGTLQILADWIAWSPGPTSGGTRGGDSQGSSTAHGQRPPGDIYLTDLEWVVNSVSMYAVQSLRRTSQHGGYRVGSGRIQQEG